MPAYVFTTNHQLSKDIHGALQDVNDSPGFQDFLPHSLIEDFVTRATVEGSLRETRVANADKLCDFVLNGRKRLFLILTVIERIKLLQSFEKCGITDDALPISITAEGAHESLDSSDVNGHHGTQCFGSWEIGDMRAFCREQGTFTAPVFGHNSRFKYRFYNSRPLPYLSDPGCSNTEPRHGFFGEVFKKMIHISHIAPEVLRLLIDMGLLPKDVARQTDRIPVAVKQAINNGDRYAGFAEKEATNLHTVVLQNYESKHLIKPIAAYEIIGGNSYLVFPWASGGNLCDYWEGIPSGPLASIHVLWVLGQFVGVCRGIQELHDSNFRHGDLKPENILWFRLHDHSPGTLQVADLGLATFHRDSTNVRHGIKTMTPSGTLRYKPPEEDERKQTENARSRFYDIWSIGCTMLELLIWLVYGYNQLRVFRDETATGFWLKTHDGSQQSMLHPHVRLYLQSIQSNTEVCGAYKELAAIIESQLLVLEIPDSYESKSGCRARAQSVHSNLQKLYDQCNASDSIHLPHGQVIRSSQMPGVVHKDEKGSLKVPGGKGVPRSVETRLPDPTAHIGEELDGNYVLVQSATVDLNSGSGSGSGSLTVGSRNIDQPNVSSSTERRSSKSARNSHVLNADDHGLAQRLIQTLPWDWVKPNVAQLTTHDCCHKNPEQLFEPVNSLNSLRVKAETCNLCHLLCSSFDRAGISSMTRSLSLRQTRTIISIEGGPNLLSIYTNPDSGLPDGAQVGLPTLLEPASDEQFILLKEWIHTCDSDSTHTACHRSIKENDSMIMPTRLIEVGQTLRLAVGCFEPTQYIALSHCWGRLTESQKFCTYKGNIEQLQLYIDEAKLPKTFQDAVIVTRGLGIKYLWIDSLCIIQDDEEDWENEARRMEDVFSSAYCTISASSATSSLEGFLSPGEARTCIQLTAADESVLYVCPFIDDFHKDVELSVLNSRGWVLQERALSRRNIHFTLSQLYWECGAGVKCETLASLRNPRAAFLGDAKFPNSALEYYKAGRQILIQDLYEKYSRLAFMQPSDRAVAILGLQKRLARAFETQAAYGFFAVYFARGLLWRRGQISPMRRITQPAGRYVPSWSWLSKEGPIRYMELKFEKIDWASRDGFRNPFSHRQAKIRDLTILQGFARRLTMSKLEDLNIAFDIDQDFDLDYLRCVVIGRDKIETSMENRRIHVLIIHQINAGVYERVGVASLSPSHVENEGYWVNIR